jgi:hypothetical protein
VDRSLVGVLTWDLGWHACCGAVALFRALFGAWPFRPFTQRCALGWLVTGLWPLEIV